MATSTPRQANPFAVLGDDDDSSDDDAGTAKHPPKAVRRLVHVAKRPQAAPRATPSVAFIFVGIIIASVIGGEVAGIVLRSPPRGYRPVPPVPPADVPRLLTHPRALTQFTPERRYVITKGTCPPVRGGLQPQQALQSAFFGRCFHCRCLGHSQKFCPIRRCKRCGAWGHSDVVCGGGSR